MGWFVAGACVAVVAFGASLSALVVGRQPTAGPRTDPETGVSLRTYPVPQPTASAPDVARKLRRVDTAVPTTSSPTDPPPTVTRASQPSATNPGRMRRPRPRPTHRCYVFRYQGHTYRYCGTHPPHP